MLEPLCPAGISVVKSDSAYIIQVNGAIDVRSAEYLHQSALAACAAGTPVCVDLANVPAVDVTALQVLLALRSELSRRNLCLTIENASASVRAYFTLAGVADLLSGESVEP